MNISQKCNCCMAEDICKFKEIYKAGVEAVLDATIQTGQCIDNRGNSYWRLRECPHIEVSIRCPHMISKPLTRGGVEG